MKKILAYPILAALIAVLFTSCMKDRDLGHNDESYWLSQESGDVVYTSEYCGIYVVETNYGYTIIRNLDGFRTYDGDVMYGNFGGYGIKNFYNYSADAVIRGEILEYDLTYYEAQDAVDYYCPFGKANKEKIRQSETSQSKTSRTNDAVKE